MLSLVARATGASGHRHCNHLLVLRLLCRNTLAVWVTQTFVLDGQVQTPVDKVMVRVTSNHGADHTCLYRVRVSGEGLRPVDDTAAQ